MISKEIKPKKLKKYPKSIFNRKELKKFLLRRAEVMRPGWEFKGVAEQYVDELEEFMRERIDKSLRRHPSKGKRIRWAQMYS